MRIGILTAAQQTGERPYNWTSVALARLHLQQGTHEQVGTGKLRFIRERLQRLHRSVRVAPSVVEKQYQRPTLRSVVVRKPLPPSSVNENLDLAYPEALRRTGDPHPAMMRECRSVRAAQSVVKQKQRNIKAEQRFYRDLLSALREMMQ